MGEEIGTSSFAAGDFARFAERLQVETAAAGDMFAAGAFSADGYSIGFEIEAWLLDHAFFPNPINEAFLAAMGDPLVVPELSRFNVELNCAPAPISGDVFSRVAAELTALWARCEKVAHGLDANIVMIGTLPVIRDDDLSLANISPLKRYRALNHEVLRQRHGRAVRIAVDGRETIDTEHCDVMLEAATTSFQVHLKTPAALAHQYWNASAMASGPLLAAAANAPFLFGRDLWDETRIPVFEQAIDLPGRDGLERVGFGRRYLDRSLFELFAENAAEFPVLLPLAFDEPASQLRHLRLHNGTIWRWNRPLIGVEDDGRAHLRIEHRTLPAGPTIADMIANAALYVGLAHDLVARGEAATPSLPFATARANFYAAARQGLAAMLTWPGIGPAPAQTLLLDHLIPAARRGLAGLGVARDGDAFIDLVEQRVRAGRNGAAWQRASRAANGGDFRRMMAAYCERQRSGLPLFQWDL
jgi:hypothetical protein